MTLDGDRYTSIRRRNEKKKNYKYERTRGILKDIDDFILFTYIVVCRAGQWPELRGDH